MHHAYLLVGSPEAAEEHLQAFLAPQGITLTGSPDFFVWKEALFGIDEARALSVAAARKAFVNKKIFFIAPEKLTHEAQNALLKTFEDPYPDTHFFLSVREEALVLPTLRSRMQTVHVKSSASDTKENEAEKFLSLSIADRLAFTKKFVDQEKNVSLFLDRLLLLSRENKLPTETVKKIYNVRQVSDDRSTSARLILEHLAVVLP
ncbi:MAG: hypothetical protein Q7R67_00605 [bacterium]|nr:hypothetical protein [bacterium]